MSNYWTEVPAAGERTQMKICLLPITVIANKYDVFAQGFEPVQRKLFC